MKAEHLGIVAGLLGIAWFGVLVWITWTVIDDGEFGWVWMLLTHAALILAAALASLLGSLYAARTKHTHVLPPLLATALGIAALVLGSIFAVAEFSGIGVPLLIVPAAVLALAAARSPAVTSA